MGAGNKARQPEDPPELESLAELFEKAKVLPAKMFVAAHRLLDEQLKSDEVTKEDARKTAVASRIIGCCLATYKVMPSLFESCIEFSPRNFLKTTTEDSTRPADARSLVGEKKHSQYTRVPRPEGDA